MADSEQRRVSVSTYDAHLRHGACGHRTVELLKKLYGIKKGQNLKKEQSIEEYNTTRTCLAQEDQDTENVESWDKILFLCTFH